MKFESQLALLAAATLLLASGCGRKEPEVTDLQRKEATYLATEADFAVTMRDYPRAEGVLVKVVALVPDNGSYWISLGSVRKKIGNAAGAKEAYQSALKAYEAQAKRAAKDSDPVLKQIYVLALLGRTDDGRALAETLPRRFPGDRNARIFIEEKQFEQMLADPGFKELAL